MNAIRVTLIEAGLLAALTILVALFGGVHAWSWGIATALLFFLLFCFPSFIQQAAAFPFSVRFFWGLVLILVLAQAYTLSVSRYATLQEALKWLAFGSALLVVQMLPASSTYRFFGFFAILGALEGLYALNEVISGSERVLWRAKDAYLGFATGTFLNRNHLAGFLEICIGIQTGLTLSALSRKKFILFLACSLLTGLTLLALYKTGSRLGMISLALGAALSGLFLDRRILIVFPAALVLAASQGEALLHRFLDVETLYSSGVARTLSWEATLRMALAYPLFGTGLGTFEYVFPAFQPATLLLGYNHAHQDYLELLATLGVPAFTMLVLGFLVLGLHLSSRSRRLSLEEKSVFAGAMMGIFAFLIHGFGDFNFAIPANHFSFLLVLALLWRMEQV